MFCNFLNLYIYSTNTIIPISSPVLWMTYISKNHSTLVVDLLLVIWPCGRTMRSCPGSYKVTILVLILFTTTCHVPPTTELYTCISMCSTRGYDTCSEVGPSSHCHGHCWTFPDLQHEDNLQDDLRCTASDLSDQVSNSWPACSS